MLNNRPDIFKMKNLTILTNRSCGPRPYQILQIREVNLDLFPYMLQLLNFGACKLTKDCVKIDEFLETVIGKRNIPNESSIERSLLRLSICYYISQCGFQDIIRNRVFNAIDFLKKSIRPYTVSFVKVGLDSGNSLHVGNSQSCTLNLSSIVLINKHKAPLKNTLKNRVYNPDKRCNYWKSKSRRKVYT